MRFWQGIGETVRAEYGLRASLTVREEEALFSRKNRRKRKSASADAPVSHRLQTVDEGAPHFLPAGFQPGFSMRGFSRFRGVFCLASWWGSSRAPGRGVACASLGRLELRGPFGEAEDD